MATTVLGLMNTSVDDCAVDLETITDLELLRALLVECYLFQHKTRAKLVLCRMKQLEKKP